MKDNNAVIDSALPTLLVVDDEQKNLHTMSRLLGHLDINMVFANSGQQALRELLYHDFFLVLMDVQMPDMNGFETAQLILESQKTAHLPIVFITAISKNEHFIHEGYSVGAVDYMHKPVDPDVLFGKVNVFKQLWKQKQSLLEKNSELLKLNKKLEEISQALSRSNEELSHMALHDSLTGLSNRSHFFRVMENSLERCRRNNTNLAVFFIDVDNFKTINDTLGHDAGDSLLKTVAQRLQMSVRTSDLVSRFGGDEFAVLAVDLGEGLDASNIAKHMLEVVALEVDLKGHKHQISLSIGIALYPESDVDAPQLLKYADTAMYKAKKSGKAGFSYYSSSLQDMASEEKKLLDELNIAIRDKQFEVFFQPLYALSSEDNASVSDGTVTALESIVRWRHPQRGLIDACDFFPAAERLGLMKAIGEWLLTELCVLLQKWQKDDLIDGENFSVSIPLSSRQIHQHGLLDSISNILAQYDILPGILELDVTEKTLLDDMVYCVEVLEQACKLGMKVAINDFGSGLISFGHLQNLPIKTLKVDPKLTSNMGDNSKNAEIIKAMMHMAKALNMTVVAEGIDEKTQRDALIDYDCNVLQGYLNTQKITVDQFESVLNDQKMH
ncbi:MAG: EAL domain-containing protein [Pseudomonadales bacterium]|nr:EAL domain-containing protein [Pseudomonadales bacterium]